MKNFIITVALFQTFTFGLLAEDLRYRFHCMQGTTGIPTQVSDAQGKVTTVKLAKDSDPASSALLDALIGQQGIWGSLKPDKDARGVTWDQGIVLIGRFSSEAMTTEGGANKAAQEPYREFKISGISIELPFARWVETDKTDPIDTPYVLEFHFELRSLIPSALLVEGKPLNLKQYESKSKSEQGADGDAEPAP